jgi:hypothetical protein
MHALRNRNPVKQKIVNKTIQSAWISKDRMN